MKIFSSELNYRLNGKGDRIKGSMYEEYNHANPTLDSYILYTCSDCGSTTNPIYGSYKL